MVISMLKKILACIMAAVIIFCLLNLNQINFNDDGILPDDEGIYETIDQQELYDELFDINSVVKINLTISKDELATLQSDLEYYRTKKSKSPIYRYADSLSVDINGTKYIINDVGVRLKGNNTKTNFYNDILGIYNLVNFKLSFNETFSSDKDKSIEEIGATDQSTKEKNQQREERTFATLQKLELKWNSNMDNTYIRNTYAFEMFKDNEILAQKCRLAVFSINGITMGVYRFFEPVDEIFINRYLPEEEQGGDLYKCSWVSTGPTTYQSDNTYGIDNRNNVEFYNFALKTNEDTSQHEQLKHLLAVLNDENLTREKLESVVDIDSFLRFSAIEYLIGNQDNMRNNYNNHYVYFRPSDGKAIFIPYDCEVCLGCTYAWNPSGNGLTEASPYSDIAAGTGEAQLSPLINLTIGTNGMYKQEFAQYLKEIGSSKWMLSTQFEYYYNIAEKNYSEYVISNMAYCSTWNHNLEFSLNGGENYNGNMSIQEFMRKIKETMYLYVR